MERREESEAERLQPFKRIRDICIGIVLGSSAFILGAYLRPSTEVVAHIKACPKGLVCIDPVKDLCLVYMDPATTGWYPVTDNNRHFVGLQVKLQKARWMPIARGIDCFHKAADKDLGELVGSLPTEMWMRNKWR